jgi:hypothetical protein
MDWSSSRRIVILADGAAPIGRIVIIGMLAPADGAAGGGASIPGRIAVFTDTGAGCGVESTGAACWRTERWLLSEQR